MSVGAKALLEDIDVNIEDHHQCVEYFDKERSKSEIFSKYKEYIC